MQSFADLIGKGQNPTRRVRLEDIGSGMFSCSSGTQKHPKAVAFGVSFWEKRSNGSTQTVEKWGFFSPV
jgi:hypothetical protein